MRPLYLFFLFLFLGAFSLNAQVLLECGVPFSGSTLGQDNNFNASDYGSCYGGSSDFNGPDQLFQIDLPDYFGLNRFAITLFSQGADDLDIFLFDATLTNCIGASLRSVQNNNTIEFILDEEEVLPPGTYYLVVDGYDSAQADDFEITLTCGNFYYNYQEIFCDDPFLTNRSMEFSDSEVSVFRVDSTYFPGYTGRGDAYYFDLAEEELVTISMDPVSSNFDLDIFLSTDFDPYNSIAFSNRNPGFSETISMVLSPGRYFLFVEGYNGSEGTYNLGIDFSCPSIVEGDPIPISCGETLVGTNVGFNNDFESYLECFDFTAINGYDYNDVLYEFTLDEAKTVEINLQILTEDLSLTFFLMKKGFTDGFIEDLDLGTCLGASPPLINLEPGTYWISVDGTTGPPFIGPPIVNKGNFELSLNCYDIPTPCDLDGEYVEQGFQLNAHLDSLDVLRALPFFSLDCVNNAYTLSNSIGRLYTYFATTSGPTTLELSNVSLDVNLDLFVFDCAFEKRFESCIANTDFNNRSLTFNADSGQYYQVLVLSDRVDELDFRLAMTSPNGPCSPKEDIEMIEFEVTYNLSGRDNDFDITRNDFYGNCGKKLSSYLGADTVFQLELRSDAGIFDLSNYTKEDKFSYGVLRLEANEAMAMYLFNYQCGGDQCIASVELPEEGGSQEIFLDFAISKAGTYYIIIDKANPGGDGTFKVSRISDFGIPNDNLLCQFIEEVPENIHTVRFQSGIIDARFQNIIVPGDMLIIDNKIKDKVGEVLYQPTLVFDWTEGDSLETNLPPVQLLRQEDTTRNVQVCGFEGFEEFSFKVIKADKSIWTLTPVFDLTQTTADPPTAFQGESVTWVRSFSVASIEPFSKVDYEPESVNMKVLTPANNRVKGHIDANNIWSIRKLPGSEWIKILKAATFSAEDDANGQSKLRSASNNQEINGGNGPLQVVFELEPNPLVNQRTGQIEIVSEAGFVKTIDITQTIDNCSTSGFQLDTLIIKDAINGANGTLNAQISGGNGPYSFRWFNEVGLIVGDSSFAASLDSGRYQLEVRDIFNCLISKSDIQINRINNGAAVVPEPITCGSTVEGTTIGAESNYGAFDYLDCTGGGIVNFYELPDAIYQFELEEAQSVLIDLEILTQGLELQPILMANDGAGGMAPVKCLDLNFTGSIFEILPAGIYWIIVDGSSGGATSENQPPTEGNFRLNLDCNPLPTPCDLEGEFIAAGTEHIFNGSNYDRFDFSPLPFFGIDCVESKYNLDSLQWFLYTYYSETTVATTIELERLLDTPSPDLFVFDCSSTDRSEICLGSADDIFLYNVGEDNIYVNNSITFNAEAGNYYQLLVLTDGQVSELDYNLKISNPGGPCDEGDITLVESINTPIIQPEDYSNYSVVGFGNDMDTSNTVFYQNCSNLEGPYTGADRVFQLNLNAVKEQGVNIPDPIDTNGIREFSYGYLYFEAAEAMGLFLFNYSCGEENCITSIELPTGGGKDSIDLDDFIRKDGFYYVVIDQLRPEGEGSFILNHIEGLEGDNFCSDPTDIHILSFSSGVLDSLREFEEGDEIRIDFKTKDYVGEIQYLDFPIFVWPEGFPAPSALNIFSALPSQEGAAREEPTDSINFQKCGFEDNEAFIFELVKKNGAIIRLEATYDESGGFSDPPDQWQPNGTSFIRRFKAVSTSPFSKLDFELASIDPRSIEPAGSSFEGHIDANLGWTVQIPSQSSWIRTFSLTSESEAQSGGLNNKNAGGALGQNQTLDAGEGPLKIGVTFEENPTNEDREGSFVIRGENGLARRVLFRQLANPCADIDLSVEADITPVDCNGNSTGRISLSPSGNGSLTYLWTNGSTEAFRENLAAGIYRVTITGESDCTTVTQFEVTEPNPLTVNVPMPADLCPGDAVFVNANISGGTPEYTIVWDGTTTSPDYEVESGTYQVQVTDANGCMAMDVFTVGVLQVPDVKIMGDTLLCFGDSTVLSGGDFPDYGWSTGETTPMITVSTAGTYYLGVTNEEGCIGLDSIIIVVSDPLMPEISGTSSLCFGDSTILSVGNYATYLWSTTATAATITVNTSGTYSVTVTDEQGCIGVDSFMVTVSDELMPQISGTASLCAGDSTELSVGDFASYAWSTNETSATITVSESGTYSVTVTDGQGCVGVDSFIVTVSDELMPQISGTASLCSGDSTELSVGDFASYAWSTNETSATILVSTSGTYSVTVTDGQGCFGVDSFMVTVSDELMPQISGTSSICSGDSTELSVGGFSSYAWSTNETSTTITVSESGTYSVTVTDEQGCIGVDSFMVTISDQLMPQISGTANLCSGDSTELSVGDFASYAWSTNETSATITVSESGVYSVTVTNEQGCIGVDTFMVTVSDELMPQISGTASLCTGDSTELSVGDFASYAWSTNETSATITVSTSGTYSVTVTDEQGCIGVDSFMVTVRDELMPQISGTASLCSGDSTELSAGDFSSYAWSTNEMSSTITVSISGTYSVTVTDEQGCIGIDSFMVTVSDELMPQISGTASLCAGDSTELSVGDFASYAWSTNETSSTITVSTSGTYSVTVTDGQGCIGVDSFMVTVSYELMPQISGTASLCSGDSTELSAGDFSSYAWSTNETSATITVSESGTYSVTVTDGQGCIGIDSFMVTVSDPLMPQISGASSLCSGDSTELSVGDFSSYAWSTNETSSTITVSTSGTYSVTVTDGQGCIGVDSFMVTVSDELMPQISGTASLCAGDSTELSVGDFSSYAWSTNETSATITVSESGTYSVTVTDEQGCIGVDSFMVTISDELMPQISGTASLCAGDSTELSVGDFVSYAWSTNETSATIIVSESGTYSVTVTDEQGCIGVDSFMVTVSDELMPQISGTASLCSGDSTELSVGDFSSYVWSTNETSATITVSESGTYSVTVTDEQGCIGADSFMVTVSNELMPQISGTASLCSGDSTELSVGDFASYEWSTAETSATITVSESGTYSVTVTDEQGCIGVDSFMVTVSDELMPQISGTASLCAGDSTELSVGDFASYAWSTNETSATITVSESGTYSVTVTDEQGCVGVDTFMVKVSDELMPQISGTANLCAGDSTELSVGDFASYAWSINETSATITVGTSGTYSVTVTDEQGCIGIDTFMVKVSDELMPQISGTASLCAGDSTELSVGDFSSYAWSTNETSATITVSESGTYSVTVTDGQGCIGVDTFMVTISDELMPQISGTASLCAGDSTELSVGDFASYAWSTAETSAAIMANTSGTYSVTVTDEQGCIGIDSFMVTVSDELMSQISGTASLCAGDSTELSVGDFASYQWSTAATSATIIVNTSGTYSVTVTDDQGCIGIDSFMVMVSDELMPQISGTANLCAGDSTELSVGDFASYQWSTAATSATITVSESGTYSVTVTDEQGCIGVDSFMVTVSDELMPQISGMASLCAGDSTDLSVGDFASYAWSTAETSATIMVSASGTYSVTVTDGQGCVGVDTFMVTVSDELMPQISGTASLCAGDSTELSVGDFASYAWSTAETSATIMVSASGTYSVTVTDGQGCVGVDSFMVTISDQLMPQVSGTASLCAGDSTELSVGDFASYAWSTAETSATIMVSASGTYSVTVTDGQGCVGVDTFMVTVSDPLMPEISGASSICARESTVLSVGDFAAYAWSTGDNSPSINVTQSGTYQVTVTNSEGCSAVDAFELSVLASPSPSIFGDFSICLGDTTVLSTSNFETYLWSTGETSQSIAVIEPGNYSITVTNINGCEGTAQFTVSNSNSINVNIQADTSFCEGETTALTVGNFDQYVWSTGETSPTITIAESGLISVTVTDVAGCRGTAQINIEVLPAPDPMISADSIDCIGGTTVLHLNSDFPNLAWDFPMNTSQINFISRTEIEVGGGGIYSVFVVGENGCEATDSFLVYEPDQIMIEPVLIIDQLDDTLGAIEIEVRGGTPPYKYSWFNELGNTISSDSNLYEIPQGIYGLLVEDANACTQAIENIAVGFVTNTEDLLQEIGFEIYPNPSLDIFNLRWNNQLQHQLQLKVLNLMGEVVYDQKIAQGDNKMELDLSTMPKGTYFLLLQDEQRVYTRKIILQ